MFCPVCKSEYREGFTLCNDCNVQLVNELPAEKETESEYVEYEELLATHSPSDRALLKSILDAEGITYFFQGEYSTIYLFQALPVRLMVNKDQVARAVELIKDLDLSFSLGGPDNPAANEDTDK
jgi:hypothetical protein